MAPEKFVEFCWLLTHSILEFGGLTGHVDHSQLPALKLARCIPPDFTSVSLFPFAPLLGIEKQANIEFMGHNKGRDNVRKRAKRRKKTERLALANDKKKKK